MLLIPIDLSTQSKYWQAMSCIYIDCSCSDTTLLLSLFLSPFINKSALISQCLSLITPDETVQVKGESFTNLWCMTSCYFCYTQSAYYTDTLFIGCICVESFGSLYVKTPRREVKQRPDITWYLSAQQPGGATMLLWAQNNNVWYVDCVQPVSVYYALYCCYIVSNVGALGLLIPYDQA